MPKDAARQPLGTTHNDLLVAGLQLVLGRAWPKIKQACVDKCVSAAVPAAPTQKPLPSPMPQVLDHQQCGARARKPQLRGRV